MAENRFYQGLLPATDEQMKLAKKLAEVYGIYSDERGMLAGYVMALILRIEEAENKIALLEQKIEDF